MLLSSTDCLQASRHADLQSATTGPPAFGVMQDGPAQPTTTGWSVPIYFGNCEPGWELKLFLDDSTNVWAEATIISGATARSTSRTRAFFTADRSIDVRMPMQPREERLLDDNHLALATVRLGRDPKGYAITDSYIVATGEKLPTAIWSVEDAVPVGFSDSGAPGRDTRQVTVTLKAGPLNESWQQERNEAKRRARFGAAIKSIGDRAGSAKDCGVLDQARILREVRDLADEALTPRTSHLLQAALRGAEIALVIGAKDGSDERPVSDTVFLRPVSTP
ncbi:MAG: hypothetical protein OXU20_42260 [Myxococcales bacterium]|nr:hypothetical protein [Myxococcales bacterium]MDD9971907.1 hypothetical protein [Myxococcales bacterium]